MPASLGRSPTYSKGWREDGRKVLSSCRTTRGALSKNSALRHFDPTGPVKVVTHASGFAIAGTLLQPVDGIADPRKQFDCQPVAFFSRKLTEAEVRYGTPDQELLAIAEAFKTWRHYLEGAPTKIRVRASTKTLSISI
jgi:hypothetical protein